MWKQWVRSLSWEDPLENGMATHSSIMAWRIAWTVLSMESQRVAPNCVSFTFTHIISLNGLFKIKITLLPYENIFISITVHFWLLRILWNAEVLEVYVFLSWCRHFNFSYHLVKGADSKVFPGSWCSLIVSILLLKFLMKTEPNTQSLYKLGLVFNLNELDISIS